MFPGITAAAAKEAAKQQIESTEYCQWMKKGNTFIPFVKPLFTSELEAGIYDLKLDDKTGFHVIKKDLFLDELLEFPSSIHIKILNHIKEFWKRRKQFKKYGFAFKRGILLHGKAGSGKSCIIHLCAIHMIKNNGVVFSLSNIHDFANYSSYIPSVFKKIEPNRQILVIIEDIDTLVKNADNESKVLNVLDGLNQLENVTYLATTNFIEELKERIINRPSRFDKREYVPFPNAADREFYFKNKLLPGDLRKISVEKWVDDTELMSIAHLAELIKSVVIMGSDYQETIDTLRDMQDIKSLHSSKYEKQTSNIGFAKK